MNQGPPVAIGSQAKPISDTPRFHREKSLVEGRRAWGHAAGVGVSNAFQVWIKTGFETSAE